MFCCTDIADEADESHCGHEKIHGSTDAFHRKYFEAGECDVRYLRQSSTGSVFQPQHFLGTSRTEIHTIFAQSGGQNVSYSNTYSLCYIPIQTPGIRADFQAISSRFFQNFSTSFNVNHFLMTLVLLPIIKSG